MIIYEVQLGIYLTIKFIIQIVQAWLQAHAFI